MANPFRIWLAVTALSAIGAICLLVLRDALAKWVESRMRRRLEPVPCARTLALFLLIWMVCWAVIQVVAAFRPLQTGVAYAVLITASIAAGISLLIVLALSWRKIAPHIPAMPRSILLWQYDEIERQRQTANLLQELAEALRQRLPLGEILAAFSVEQRGAFAESLKAAAERVKCGGALSDALDAGRFAPPHALAAVRAGEAGGGRALPGALRGAALDMRDEAAARSSVMAIIFYPIVVGIVCIGIALFLMIYLLPKFTYVFRALSHGGLYYAPRLGLENVAPWWTNWMESVKLLVFISFVILALTPILGANVGPCESGLPSRAHRILGWLEDHLPFFRARLRNRALARCARVLAALVECEMPLPQACAQVATAAIAGPFTRQFAELGRALNRGAPLGEALRDSRLPDSFSWLAQAGAAGGQLHTALTTAAEWHESKVRRINRVVTLMLPCVIIPTMGLMVGFVYGGVFNAINTIREFMTAPLFGP